MESSKSRRLEKRGHEKIAEDAADYALDIKRPKLPALASVIVEALKVDSLQRLSSSLEPLLRRIVSEEVERALTKYGHATPTGRSTPPRIQRPQGRNLQLHFRTKMPPQLFTGGKVEGEQGAAIHVVLLEMNSGSVVQSGPEASAKLSVVVLEGDFNEEDDDDWTNENFESYEVKEREGKRPLLAGDLQVSLKEGVGTLGELSFTDNSSWIRSRKFRLGVKVAPGYSEEIHIREAKTNAFAVKDHRGELYKKHYPPALHDEVWRLDRIAKDGALHKKLLKADIVTVEDFLRLLVRDPQNLRNILGSGMSNRMWENTVEHAKTCVLGGKLYVYYADQSNGSGIVFNHIYELRGLIASGQFIQLDSLTDNQKMSVDFLVKQAYENWHQVIEYDGKVLISQVSSRGERKSLLAPTAHRNSLASHNLVVQNMQQHNTSGSVLTYENQNNYYSMRPDQTDGVVSNYPQGALMAGTDYSLAGTSGQRNSYYSGEWSQQRSGQGLEDMISEEIRLRSSEMLRAEEMQNLLKTFGLGFGGGLGTSCNNSFEACYSYGGPCEKQVDRAFGHERGTSGKAVVGWLKLKAALRWGIFVRKRAAERRAHLVELD